ncbi:MAG: double-strand break repair protein AddB [Alphaproteobacteria bacterium]|nr:double-strand break repair protein AddB [Alphaproteobacteria bacterium]
MTANLRQGDLFAPIARGRPAPAVYTLPAQRPFVDHLARGLLHRYPGEQLTKVLVLLPTRRAVRSLLDAFLRVVEGKALLLPMIRPIGDIDEEDLPFAVDVGNPEDAIGLPPAISRLTRQVILGQLIERWMGRTLPMGTAHAVELAVALGDLIDQVYTERLDFTALRSLVPADYANHWQKTVDFLTVVTDHWPRILEERGELDPADRRNRLIDLQIARWRADPPATPIVAAGSTGTVAATAGMLALIARLPQGAVILPGLDSGLDEVSWRQLDPGHPQFTMKQLLERLQVARGEVLPWDDVDEPSPRFVLLREALRPAATTERWQHLTLDAADLTRDLTRIACAGPRDEAIVVALILREALETPGRTAALVTPDRNLARRVACELTRWGIAIDDTAGVPLANTAAGTFLRLSARAAANALAPVDLLALLKHPFAAAGQAPGTFRSMVRRLELAALRGPRPKPGIEGLRAAVDRDAELKPWLDRWYAMVEALVRAFRQRRETVADLLEAHVGACRALAATNQETGDERLWRGDDGEALSLFVDELAAAVEDGPLIATADYPDLLDRFLMQRAVRPRFGRHPRLAIWGPLEARLQAADVVVLGGLNDGTWPTHPEVDPWMSRPMRHAFGLPPPERRIGQSAHDFVQAACAPTIFLTRSEKVDAAPTVASRWWLRIDTVLGEPVAAEKERANRYRAWAAAIDLPEGSVRPVAPPAFAPPLRYRPRGLYVTDVETLVRNPYGVYAKHVLKLRKLDAIDEDAQMSDRGTFVHRALEAFGRELPDILPDDAFELLLEHGRRAFSGFVGRPSLKVFWWRWFERAGRWFIDTERERRQHRRPIAAEITGTLNLDAPGGTFTLNAKADRLDRFTDESLAIVDYKTGGLPTQRDIKNGLVPQLVLEALIARAGGFPDLGHAAVSVLEYLKFGGADGGQTLAVQRVLDRMTEAEAGLARLIAAFDDEKTPYLAVPRPQAAPRFDDYEHLARIKEWTAQGDREAS